MGDFERTLEMNLSGSCRLAMKRGDRKLARSLQYPARTGV